MWFNVSLLFLLFAAATSSSSSDLVNHADANGSKEMLQHHPVVKELGPYAAAWKNLNKDDKQEIVMKLAQMIVVETFHQNQIKKLGDANAVNADSLKADGPILNEHQKKYQLRAKRAAHYNYNSDSCYFRDDDGQCWTKAEINTGITIMIVIPIILVCCCIIIIGIVVTVYCVTKKKKDPPPPQIQYAAPAGPPPPQAEPVAAGAPPPAQQSADNAPPT